MWCRRRATAAAGRLLLRLLLVVVLLLQAPAAAQSSKRFLRSAEPRDSNLKIVGSIIFPVKVYVKLNQNGPRILCVTNRLRNLELIDPVFQWRGPGGNILSENSSVKISPTGTLMFKRFKSNQSGVYTCSLVYKLTAEQPAKNLIMTYLIYAYSDSNYYYEFTAQYHAAPCNSIYNISFEKALLQARYLIEKFFEQQVEIMRKSSEPLPEIYYIEGTLQMVWVDRCYPGYGMNPLRHPDCPDCCVVCSPGSYNPSNRIHCLPCNNSFMYGATKC